MNKDAFAKDLLHFKSTIDSGQKFGRDTIHLFCSPLFVDTMKALFDKNIETMSCGSGAERNILPGITCNFESLSDENKKLTTHLKISPTEIRIGAPIHPTTTFKEFEAELLKVIGILKKQ